MVKQTKKIKFIICYFGKWPIWFPGFLLSCKHNEDIDWLFFTDCKIPKEYPSNVKFEKCSIDFISELASKKLKFKVKITKPYKLCDLKPAYGLVFEDYLESYDFWGHCDIDIIFGDIRKFITNDILAQNDIISSFKKRTSGHFTLFKNNHSINNIFLKLDNYHININLEKNLMIDERAMTQYLKKHINEYKISWNTWLFNFPHDFLEENDNKTPGRLTPNCGPWHWEKGKIYIDNSEVMYLHFMTWKRSLKHINFKYKDNIESFTINNTKISANCCGNICRKKLKTYINQSKIYNDKS